MDGGSGSNSSGNSSGSGSVSDGSKMTGDVCISSRYLRKMC